MSDRSSAAAVSSRSSSSSSSPAGHNNMPPPIAEAPAPKEESKRDRALREAAQVVDSEGYHRRAIGFNLLGVVANPRSGTFKGLSNHGSSGIPSSSSHSLMTSSNARIASIQEGSLSTSATNTTDTSLWTSGATSLVALEETFHQMTEGLDAMNKVFDQWSRQYLGHLYDGESSALEYLPPLDVEPYQLQELPPELASLSLASVQQYLDECGLCSHNFHVRSKQQGTRNEWGELVVAASGPEQQQSTRRRSGSSTEAEEEDMELAFMDDLYDNVPDAFFETYFDLTDPTIFCELLVLEADAIKDEEQVAAAQEITTLAASTSLPSSSPTTPPTPDLVGLLPSLGVPTKDILRLPPPDSFTGHLDKVEVALLKQVRSKSNAFFHETNRFGQLKEWISALVADVQSVRSGLQTVQDGSIIAWELIPRLDDRRHDLMRLQHTLEIANEVLRCKSSIGGLLSAGDHLMAAEQIQYGRRLLAGKASQERRMLQMADDKNNNGDTSSNSASDDEKNKHNNKNVLNDSVEEEEEEFEIGRLSALNTVGDQLSQYERLVVANLSEELVEILLSWKMSASVSSSLYGDTSSTNGGSALPSNTFHLVRTSQETKKRVRDIMRALGMCKSLTNTGKAYGQRLNDVIRMTVRTTVGEFSGEFAASDNDEGGENKKEASVAIGVTSMSLDRFMDCVDMLFEQLLALLKSAVGVNNFCREENFTLKDETQTTNANSGSTPPAPKGTLSTSGKSTASTRVLTATAEAMSAAAELSSKSVSELLRLRKEAHSLVTLEEMKLLWDACLSFTLQLEKACGHKAYGLRSTLLAQAKAFVERKHDSNMSALVAALDSERWMQCDVSAERQAALTRLCSGRAVMSSNRLGGLIQGECATTEKTTDADVEGIRYKVVWSCLLLVEMVMTNLACAAQFQALATNVVGKVTELLRLFNSRSTQLVLGAGAIQSAARLKSINAKHLSLVTQCVGMIITILPHIRAALMAQLPSKQHTLLGDLDKIKREYADHSEKVLNKFVNIIGGIVEHGLAPRIGTSDFDARSNAMPLPEDDVPLPIPCCVFLEGITTNTKKMHQVLNSLLPNVHLQDVFLRIFAYVDQKIPTMFIALDASNAPENRPANAPIFHFPKTDEGKRRMLLEVESVTINLNGLNGVRPWEFTAMNVLERKLEYELRPKEPAENDEGGDPVEAPAHDRTKPQTTESEDAPAVNGDPKESIKKEEQHAELSQPDVSAPSPAEEDAIATSPDEVTTQTSKNEDMPISNGISNEPLNEDMPISNGISNESLPSTDASDHSHAPIGIS